MKTKVLNIGFAVILMMISTQLLAQSYLISGGGTITTCAGTLYDSGGAGGNYGNNENYVITICGDLPGAMMTLEFTYFHFESPSYDYLSIYDGPSTMSPAIITNQGYTALQGVTIQATGDCITLYMRTDGSGTYGGFAAEISCGFPCQDYTIDIISSNPPLSPPMDSLWIDVCQGTNIEFTAEGDYPNNNTDYPQSDATLLWDWRIVKENDIEEYSGVGLTSINHTFIESGGYRIYLEGTDVNGCVVAIEQPWRVRVSIDPTFVASILEDTVCPYDTVHLTGDVIPNSWEEEFMDEVAQETFLPDGSGVTYTTSITNGTFIPGSQISTVNDIISLCVNMEHTYMGDLSMRLECPNGQIMEVFAQGGGSTILGEPVGTSLPVDSNSGDITPGIGYDYCWSPTSTSGPISSNANWQTVSPYVDPIGNVSNSVNQLIPGTYQITGNWSDLVGCPLNGDWTIHITDHMNLDNGYIFSWQLNFAPALIPTNLWHIINSYESSNYHWSGHGLGANSGGTAIAIPTEPGDHVYTFSAVDDFGCAYEEANYMVHVRAVDDSLCCVMPEADAGLDDHVCTNTYTFNASLDEGNTGTWALVSGPGNATWTNQDSPNAIVTVDEWGLYVFVWAEQNQTPACTDSAEIIIEFYPMPTTTFTFDQIMCHEDRTTITYIGNVDENATYNWDFGGASVVSGNGQGPYQIFWTDAGMQSIGLQIEANGCSSDDTLVNIINPPLLSHTLMVDNDPCFESCRGRAELTLEGGILPYNYSWGSPTNILNNICSGSYGVTVTDANGCTTGQAYVVDQPPALVINSITTSNLTCYQSNDGEINLAVSGGTGNLTYSWSDGGADNPNRSNLPAGNYVVTISDENGCSVVEQFQITQPDELVITTSPSVAICEGTITTLQAEAQGGTPAYTYYWDRGEGYNVAGANLNLMLDTTTMFFVYVEDAHGCISNTRAIKVTVSPEMIIDELLVRDNRCFNSCDGRAEIIMHGGIPPLQYSWGSQTNIYSGLCAGAYTVTVTDVIGCKVSEMFIITEPDEMIDTTYTTPATCFGYNDGEATIFVQGGVPPYSYLWPNGHDESTMLNYAGNYTVTVLDDHLCLVTASIVIEQPDAIYVQPIGNRTVCNGQSTILATQATGGTPDYDFHWTGTDSTVYHSNQYQVSPTQTTTYTLVVTDANGCSSTPQTSIVTVNPDLEILSILTSNDTVCQGDPAIIHVDVEGGNGGPYLMSLQDGRVVPSPFTVYPDTTTMFYITLKDMCGTAAVVDSILINVRPKPGNVFVVEDVEGCPPFAASFTEKSPQSGQTYLWQFGDDSFSRDKSPTHVYTKPGTYTVTLEVSDYFGCKHKRTVENMIHVYPKPTAVFEANPEVVSMLSAEVKFINYSTNADYYYWLFGDGDSSLLVSPRHKYPTIGEYEVILIAATQNNCKDTTSRVIEVRNEFAFYMPNSFTPNGDGINDCFRPCGNGIDKNSFKMMVYDRWGNLVFKTDKFDANVSCDACSEGAWDGTDNGSRAKGDEILPNGLYHWYCEFYDWNGTLYNEQGTVTLIR